MKNIHSINFIKHTTLLACSALLAVSLAACSQPAASDAASTAGSASSSATSDTAQIPNPWTGCTTLADAAALTGYDFTVPDSVDGYPDVTIAVLESEQLTEVQYSSGNARLCLRKAPGSDDIVPGTKDGKIPVGCTGIPMFDPRGAAAERLMEKFCAEHTADELEKIFNEAGVPCQRAYGPADILADPHVFFHGKYVVWMAVTGFRG